MCATFFHPYFSLSLALFALYGQGCSIEFPENNSSISEKIPLEAIIRTARPGTTLLLSSPAGTKRIVCPQRGISPVSFGLLFPGLYTLAVEGESAWASFAVKSARE